MHRFVETIHVKRVVVGSGIAGLTTALTCGDALIITRRDVGSGASRMAQGGIAACLDAADSPQAHADDTYDVSAGIGDPSVARAVAQAAAGRIEWLFDRGARFDRSADGSLSLGREAGHSARRIVHANGDATGAEVMRALVCAARQRADLDVLSDATVLDLIRDDHGVAGVLCLIDHRMLAVLADHVVLACGGIGGLYTHTTNPPEVAGDGLAMAARAGATLADIEFVQFHPTTLDTGTDPAPLLTEALRGEGAQLIDEHGQRIMRGVHRDMELGPRDVVARQIWRVAQPGHRVFLDATCIGAAFAHRFPTVFSAARAGGFDARVDPLPVMPAAHYHMGGIATDVHGRTSLPGLWAVGEVACTGLHGGNRLASNSLLEGLVMGAMAGSMIRQPPGLRSGHPPAQRTLRVPDGVFELADGDDAQAVQTLRTIMWDHVGIERDAEGLRRAVDLLGAMDESSRRIGNMTLAGRLIAQAALARNESRGSHARRDYPASDARQASRSFITPTPACTMRLVPDRCLVVA